jgi:HSP20 family protein
MYGPSGLGDLHTRIKQVLKEAKSMGVSHSPGSPTVYGFTLAFTRDGKPVIEEFGNVSPHGVAGFTEPITDVIERFDSVSVIVELPGVSRDDIDLRASVESLFIKVDLPFRKYSKAVRFSCRVRPESASARYNNSVLEVTLKRVDDSAVGKKVKVD